MNHKKYLIWAPPFRRSSAGITVLHKLCHLLNNKGFIAYVTGAPNPDWNELYADESKIKELLSEDAIVVYPEIVTGNPFFAKFVVRYVLNKPGRLGGRKSYDRHEIVYCYYEILGKTLSKPCRVLEMPLYELELFNNDSNYARSGNVFYVGKGKKTPKIQETESAVEITREYPPTRKELAELFKKSELFYSYDNFTALIEEARLCGCPVVIIPDVNYSREEVLNALTGFGLSYGLGDIEYAKETVQKFGDAYKERLKKTFNLDDFIRTTQELTSAGLGYPDIDLALGR